MFAPQKINLRLRFDCKTNVNLPKNIIKLIFSREYLDPQDEDNLRLTCKYFKDLCDRSPRLFRAFFHSGKAWELEAEEFVPLLFSHPALFFRMLDRLDPLGLPNELFSLRGKIIDKIKLTQKERLVQLSHDINKLINKARESNQSSQEELNQLHMENEAIRSAILLNITNFIEVDNSFYSSTLKEFIFTLEDALKKSEHLSEVSQSLEKLMQKAKLLNPEDGHIQAFKVDLDTLMREETPQTINEIMKYLKDQEALHNLVMTLQKMAEEATNRFKFYHELFELKSHLTNIEDYLMKNVDHLESIPLSNEDELCRVRIEKKGELQKKFREIMMKTGDNLKFSFYNEEQEVSYFYEKLPQIIKELENHLLLHRHWKSLFLLSQCHHGEEIPETFFFNDIGNTLYNSFLNIENISKEKGVFTKTLEINKNHKWLLHQPYWAAYTNDPETWYHQFKYYDQVNVINPPTREAEKIVTLFSHLFTKDGFNQHTWVFREMCKTLYNVYDLTNSIDKQIEFYKGIPSPTIEEVLILTKAYLNADRYQEALDLFEAILKMPEEKNLRVVEKYGTFRSYILRKHLKTILKSDVYGQYKEKAYDILNELLRATEGTQKLRIKVSIDSGEGAYTHFSCNTHLKRKHVLFYQNCLKYLFGKESITKCLGKGTSYALVYNMIKNADLSQFKTEELKSLKNFFKKLFTKFFSYIGKCEGDLRIYLGNQNIIKKMLPFIKNLFSDEPKTLQYFKKLAPELFKDINGKNEKKKK